MQIALELAGYQLDAAASPDEAFSLLARNRYAAILLDMNFQAGSVDGEEGLTCLQRILGDDPSACVVVITAHSGIRIAVAAMRAGASDFVMKPWRNADLISKIEAAIARLAPAPARSVATRNEPQPLLLGESEVMRRLRSLISRVAPTSAGIAVVGPPGSGRTLTAQAIHSRSRDCDARPERVDLLDEAAWARLGTASGTAILRNADRLGPTAQDRLLDLLPVDLRCIAIVEAIEPIGPALRRRIATVEVVVPPLRNRGEDAVLLARHFAISAAERFGTHLMRLTPAAEALVLSSTWAGEVRGLALAVERAALLAEGETIDAAALAPSASAPDIQPTPEGGFDLSDCERLMIEAALREHRHNVTRASVALGLSRGALYRRMARHGM